MPVPSVIKWNKSAQAQRMRPGQAIVLTALGGAQPTVGVRVPTEGPKISTTLRRTTVENAGRPIACPAIFFPLHHSLSLTSFPSSLSHLRPRPSCAAVRTPSKQPEHRDPSHSLGRSGRLSLLAAQVNGRRRSLGKDGYCAWEHSPQYPDFPGPNGPQIREYHIYWEQGRRENEHTSSSLIIHG